MPMSAQQQADLGIKIADLKARLHDAENCVSRNEMDALDWNELTGKLCLVLGEVLNQRSQLLIAAVVQRPEPYAEPVPGTPVVPCNLTNIQDSPPTMHQPALFQNDVDRQVVAEPAPAYTGDDDDEYDPYGEDSETD